MSKLKNFYFDKELKKEVFDHITRYARERLEEDAMKELPTIWFRRLVDVINDSDKALTDMFEITQDKIPVNRAK